MRCPVLPLVHLLVVALSTCCVRAQYDAYQFPETTVTDMGGNATFICDCGEGCFAIPANSTPSFWILPNLDNTNSSVYSNIYVTPDGSNLTVMGIRQSDFGSYFCVLITPEDEFFMQRHGLNVRGPYFEDLGEKYSRNVVLGFSGMLSFLASALYVWVVYRFSYNRRTGTKMEPEVDHELPNGMSLTEIKTDPKGGDYAQMEKESLTVSDLGASAKAVEAGAVNRGCEAEEAETVSQRL